MHVRRGRRHAPRRSRRGSARSATRPSAPRTRTTARSPRERLAKLASRLAVIHVGAATDVVLNEKRHRTEGALAATRAAVSEGIVPGGGTALLRAEEALENLELEGDYAIGADLVRRVLSEPLYWIATNAGYDGRAAIDEVRAMPERRRPERAHGRVRRPARGRRDRPGARDAADDRERGVGRGAAAHDRGRRGRGAARAARRDHRARASATSRRGSRARARPCKHRGLLWPNAESAVNSDPWLVANHDRIRSMRPRVLVVNFVHGLARGRRARPARAAARRPARVVALAGLPRSGGAAVPRLRASSASST